MTFVWSYEICLDMNSCPNSILFVPKFCFVIFLSGLKYILVIKKYV